MLGFCTALSPATLRYGSLMASLCLLLTCPLALAVAADDNQQRPKAGEGSQSLQEIAGSYWSEGPFLGRDEETGVWREDTEREVDRWWKWWEEEDSHRNADQDRPDQESSTSRSWRLDPQSGWLPLPELESPRESELDDRLIFGDDGFLE